MAPADLYPAYVHERARLLSNAACMLRCARQYSRVRADAGLAYRSNRKFYQRGLASLRCKWAPVREALRLAASINPKLART